MVKEDERPVGIPQLNEIKQIIDNDNTQGFTGLKLKISEIIDDEVNSLKVIQMVLSIMNIIKYFFPLTQTCMVFLQRKYY